ncbi:hypothetical protein ACIOHS_25980 [Streptomyces sp. NPDC088253]|uniref:hypothetical protein n=1 Tax=Streptomyces sp. NPDC088253 TaxID=3365846 RepID=UPI0038238B5C
MSIEFTGPVKITPEARIQNIAKEYVAQILSIIEINRSVIPEMAAQDDNEHFRLSAQIVSRLSPTERDDYAASLREVAEGLRVAANAAKEGEGTAKHSINFKDRTVGSAITHYIMEMSSRKLAEPRGALLRKSLLVSAISTFEVLFGQIAREIYTVNTSSLNDSEYRFTLQELADFPAR